MTPTDDTSPSLSCPIYYGNSSLATDDSHIWRPVDDLFASDSYAERAVVLVDASMVDRRHDLRHLPHHLVLVAADRTAEAALDKVRLTHISIAGIHGRAAQLNVLQTACELACARHTAVRRWRYMTEINRELSELIHIGMELMSEHDRKALLHRIVEVGKQFTESDAGALLLVEAEDGKPPVMRLVLLEIDSLDITSTDLDIVPIDNDSIVGHAALTGKAVVVADAYNLPEGADYILNKSVDERFGYRRRSMLIVPMADHLGHVVGVMVFVNRKSDPSARIRTKEDADRYVLEYTQREVRLARSLAGEAAVSIENARLYAQIERTLESFVRAAVTAIDQRDPTTSGHSVRVAALTTELAMAVDRDDSGPLRNVHFTRKQMRELRFAALLHDFGKVAVPDDVLLKARKLPPPLWERVSGRFDLIHRTLEVEHYQARERLLATGTSPAKARQLDTELADKLAELARLRRIVSRANEPTVENQPPLPELQELARRTFTLPDGTTVPYLTAEELHFLEIRYGSLDERERLEAQSHVQETYEFLKRITWTDDLKNLVPFAYGHHEKLTGVGYPRGLHGDEIPIQTRMITIADMFDALTEADRPYKPAVSPERAIEILSAEAKAGRLDSELVRLMADARPYARIIESDWRSL